MKKIFTAQNIATVGLLGGVMLLVLLFIEAMTTFPSYTTEPATIRKVIKDPTWGASDWLTLGRFKDGTPAQQRGDLGDPGETVRMIRENGTTSLFGILGDRSAFDKNNDN